MTEPQIAETRKGLLCDIHLASGATMGEWYGWEMPSHYAHADEEHDVVRSRVGIIDLSSHGAITVGGSEGEKFLQGLVTNDVKVLGVGEIIDAAFLTGHGKVRALCRILRREDGFMIINDPQSHDKIFKYVFPFSYAGDFQVADVSDEYRMLSLQGPASIALLKEVSFEPVPDLNVNKSFQTTIAGYHCTLTGSNRTGETGIDLLVQSKALKDVWEFLMLKGEFHGVRPFGQAALDSLRIEAGKLVYGIDVDETNMMLETGLKDSVSFTKGCYTGQEAVAMATYRGHVSKQIAGLRIEEGDLPRHGDKILVDDKEVGSITSSTASKTIGGVISLGYVKYGFNEIGKHATIVGADATSRATIVALPFYDRSPKPVPDPD